MPVDTNTFFLYTSAVYFPPIPHFRSYYCLFNLFQTVSIKSYYTSMAHTIHSAFTVNKTRKPFLIKGKRVKHDASINLFTLGNHGKHFVHYIAGSSKPSCGSGLHAEEQLTDRVKYS